MNIQTIECLKYSLFFLIMKTIMEWAYITLKRKTIYFFRLFKICKKKSWIFTLTPITALLPFCYFDWFIVSFFQNIFCICCDFFFSHFLFFFFFFFTFLGFPIFVTRCHWLSNVSFFKNIFFVFQKKVAKKTKEEIS